MTTNAPKGTHMGDTLITELRREHFQDDFNCDGCGDTWPCPPSRAADRLEELSRQPEPIGYLSAPERPFLLDAALVVKQRPEKAAPHHQVWYALVPLR